MLNHPTPRTQFLIFLVFGEVVLAHGERIWTAGLLQVLRLLGVSERAARSTLSRMTSKGWIRPERSGRHSAYTLTPRGTQLLNEGGVRLFEPRDRNWDGRWHLVVYSLPEREHDLRNALRKRLAWLGFGRLAAGTWVSPYDRQAEVMAVLADLGVTAYAQLFSGSRVATGDDHDVVERCWDLKSLNRQYASFIDRWGVTYASTAQAIVDGDLSPAECFVQRFWISQDYSIFPHLDPNLPAALLPDDWLGDKAARLMQAYRQLLSPCANAFVATLLTHPDNR